MNTKLRATSLLPSVGSAPMTPAAQVSGTAVSAAACTAAVLAFGIDVPGPPRGAPV